MFIVVCHPRGCPAAGPACVDLPQRRRQRPRRYRVRLLIAAQLVLHSAGAALATSDEAGPWHCAAEVATAYRYDVERNRWATLVMPVANQRFIVRQSAAGWIVVPEAARDQPASCPGGFDAAGLLRCGPNDEFRFDRKRLTFASQLFVAGELDARVLTGLTAAGHCVRRSGPK